MATYINGFGGDITFNSVTLGVQKWELTASAGPADTTNTADSGWESHVLGAKSWESSVDAFWDASAVPTGSFPLGTYATMTLKAGTASGTNKQYSGTALLQSYTVTVDPKGAMTYKMKLKGTGSLTQAT